jgi:hypothetical protein
VAGLLLLMLYPFIMIKISLYVLVTLENKGNSAEFS